MHRKPEPPPKETGEVEAEDLQVAHFYQQDGNFRGAYLRAQHAVSLVPEDADAHLAVGLAARRIGKLDEALKEFKKTLELDPVPKTRKEAQEALREMTGN